MSSASSVLIEHNRKLQGQVKDLEGDETADAEKEKKIEDLKKEIKTIESDLETLVEAVDRIRETYPVVGESVFPKRQTVQQLINL